MKKVFAASFCALMIVGIFAWPENEAEAEVVCREAIMGWSWDLMAWICIDSNGPGQVCILCSEGGKKEGPFQDTP